MMCFFFRLTSQRLMKFGLVSQLSCIMIVSGPKAAWSVVVMDVFDAIAAVKITLHIGL